MSCDCNLTYNEWAIARLNAVPKKSVDAWIKFDRETAARREGIR